MSKTMLIDAAHEEETRVVVLDGRLSSYNMNAAAKRQAQRLEHIKQYSAFRIVSGARLFEEQRTSVVFKLTYPIRTN